ncbi:peptidoglycan-binding domain-containing protein [Streptomyces sp. NBC_00005]|uniref:peptidoglycan-binding domain-containing protein n=1 Tax=Streptomyces sp. NBC_00005 TaxID=2903609 RepID=UPI00324A794A
MTDPEGHQCPECGAPRGADNTPSCGCTQRASDALRDTRTAEAAAAEDFDPLRIRPYVELERAPEGAGAERPAAPAVPAVPAAEATMPLRAVSPDVPSADDLRLFEGTGPEVTYEDDDDDAVRPRGRGRTVLLGVGGAAVAVMTAAGLASGLFSYETPTRDSALPDDVRASVPDDPASAASESPSRSATTVRPPAPPAPVSTSPSPSASPSTTSASPSPSRSAEPTQTSPTATASSGAPDNGRQAPPVLSRGSDGPEVTELELRLTQLGLYTRKASGHYNEGVEDAVSRYQLARGLQQDGLGTYGAETRARLESETTEP